MNKNIILILHIFLLSLLTACDNERDGVSETIKTGSGVPGLRLPCEEYGSPLNIVNKDDTLKILIEASECGEWGGHRENILIQRNKDNKIFARFIMDTVPCDKIINAGGGLGVLDDKTRVIISDTTKMLSLMDEKIISMFLQKLLELYLKNERDANSGYKYYIINTDSTMNFKYWNSGDCRDTYYRFVRKQVFGDILKIKQ
jgi:hypothetical protein